MSSRTRPASGSGRTTGGGAQHDLDPVAVVVNVAGGELDDAGDALGVEEQEQSGDSVGGRQRAVVQEPPGVVPAFLAVVRAARALPADGTEGEVAGGPAGGPHREAEGGLGPGGGAHARGRMALGRRVAGRVCPT